SVMTFFHFVEEAIEPQLPFSPFTEDLYSLSSRDANGRVLVSQTRLFNPFYSRKRNLEKLAFHLKRRVAWRQSKVGNVILMLFEREHVLSTCRDLADKGIYCYDS